MSKRLKKTHLFSKDINSLLYAYGDVTQPLPQTVSCLDELVSAYLVDVCTVAYRTAKCTQRNKVKLDDFKFVMRRDPVKFARAEELINTNKLIIEAKKQFSETDNQSLKRYRSKDNGDDDDDESDNDDTNQDDNINNNSNGNSANNSSNTKQRQNKKQKQKQ